MHVWMWVSREHKVSWTSYAASRPSMTRQGYTGHKPTRAYGQRRVWLATRLVT